MKVLVVGLKRRSDRQARLKRWIPQHWCLRFLSDEGLDWDGATIEDWPGLPHLFNWKIVSENSWWNRPLRAGEVGCSMSHIEAWKIVAKDSKGFHLILEDDVNGLEGFDSKISEFLEWLSANAPNWDLAYVGREPLTFSEQILTEKISKPDYSYGSYGYLLSGIGAQKLLAYNLQSDLIPVDEFLPATFSSHPRLDVRTRFKPSLEAFALIPPTIDHPNHQDSDTEGSEELEREVATGA